MYSIAPIPPEHALSFEPLAPFEVRHVLEDLGALDRVHAVGATLFGQPVGLGLAVRGWAESNTYSGAAPAADTARLLTLTVARTYRRLGIGRAMLSAIRDALAAHGTHTMTCNYAIASAEGVATLEAFFSAVGWGPPVVTMLQCRAGHAILGAPMLRDELALPPEYEITDWVDLSAHDRAHIRERQARAPWYPESLDPFHFEPELEPLNSLALRYHGEVVGWLITRRTAPTSMYYRCLFVRADLARLGRAIPLICEAIRRHHALIGSRPGFGEWSTPTSLPPMVRFIRRHLEPFGAQVVEQRQATAHWQRTAGNGQEAAARRVQRRGVVRRAVFDQGACNAIVDRVHALRERWTSRFDTLPFHSLGAVARLDAFDSMEVYERAARAGNAVLRQEFGRECDGVLAALGSALGAPAAFREGWALPAIHITHASPGADLPIGAVHCDVQHQYVNPGAVYAERPVSFSLLLGGEASHASIRMWDLGFDETVGLDTEETARLLDAVAATDEPLERGALLVHASDTFHQVSPLPRAAPAAERITLEGHAVFADGTWWVYG